jgi:cyclopropane fatty-acyl-phospholipid synthase-like methyltransferase
MDRSDWLKEQRREAEEKYDTLWAPLYGEKWGVYDNRSHQQFIRKFLKLLPQESTILDAACGAGRYMAMLLKKGHSVVGIDQSLGMLSRASEKFPLVQLAKIGLQEMSYIAAFDGAICMDAMEHIFPEDWPIVLSNFQRALKPQGYLYFTVEIADEKEIEEAFIRGQQAGIPVVYGEWADQEVYHYYPPLEKVREWIQQASFDLIEEGEGDGYHHFLVRKAALEPIELPMTEEVSVAQPLAAAVSG